MQSLDGLYSLTFDPNIGDSLANTSTTIPDVTISGSGDGTFDYYSFAVNRAGDRAIFDIDQANFDTEIFLYDLLGSLLAENDDSFFGREGEAPALTIRTSNTCSYRPVRT